MVRIVKKLTFTPACAATFSAFCTKGSNAQEATSAKSWSAGRLDGANGGNLSFAAICSDVCNAQEADFAKSCWHIRVSGATGPLWDFGPGTGNDRSQVEVAMKPCMKPAILTLCVILANPASAFTVLDDPEALAILEGYTDAANGPCNPHLNADYDPLVYDVFFPLADALNATGLYPVGAGAFRMHRDTVGADAACAELSGFLSGEFPFDKKAVAARNAAVEVHWK